MTGHCDHQAKTSLILGEVDGRILEAVVKFFVFPCMEGCIIP